MDTRIPIEDIADFNRVRIQGYSTGIRWSAAMEAMEKSLQEKIKARKNAPKPYVTTWQDRYIVR